MARTQMPSSGWEADGDTGGAAAAASGAARAAETMISPVSGRMMSVLYASGQARVCIVIISQSRLDPARVRSASGAFGRLRFGRTARARGGLTRGRLVGRTRGFLALLGGLGVGIAVGRRRIGRVGVGHA